MRLLYADRELVVVDKPSGLLSVPGVYTRFSLVTACQQAFGLQRADHMIAHRLDEATSGVFVSIASHCICRATQAETAVADAEALSAAPHRLSFCHCVSGNQITKQRFRCFFSCFALWFEHFSSSPRFASLKNHILHFNQVMARNPEAQKALFGQFARREVSKTYTALVEGTLAETEGEVRQPGFLSKLSVTLNRRSVTNDLRLRIFCARSHSTRRINIESSRISLCALTHPYHARSLSQADRVPDL